MYLTTMATVVVFLCLGIYVLIKLTYVICNEHDISFKVQRQRKYS